MLVVSMMAMSAFDCKRDLANKVPLNYIIVFFSTALIGVMAGVFCTYKSTSNILVGILITMLVVGGLSLYARTTERGFTGVSLWLTTATVAFGCIGSVMSNMC